MKNTVPTEKDEVPTIDKKLIIPIIQQHYPEVEAISLFGSYACGQQWPQSDVDIAVLLPVVLDAGLTTAPVQKELPMAISPCASALSHLLRSDVDLVNLRRVSTVFQNEIINTGRWLYVKDKDMDVVLAFEMQVLSAHQKLNEERAAILRSFLETKRAYNL